MSTGVTQAIVPPSQALGREGVGLLTLWASSGGQGFVDRLRTFTNNTRTGRNRQFCGFPLDGAVVIPVWPHGDSGAGTWSPCMAAGWWLETARRRVMYRDRRGGGAMRSLSMQVIYTSGSEM